MTKKDGQSGRWLRFALLVVIAGVVGAFFAFDLGRYLAFDYLKASQGRFQEYYAANQAATLVAFFVIYVVSTALSLPGAAILTLAAGALFGLATGVVLVSFASSLGATCAFMAARFLLRDSIQRKFGDKLRAINEGIEREGAFFLFTLRLIPLFPFFVINLVLGLTPMRAGVFYLVSQIGMLPGTMVYVNAGTQLARLDSLGGIMSPALLGSFALLGLFPYIARRVIGWQTGRRVLRRWRRPSATDYNLVVIGAGAAGLVTSYIAAAVKARVALVEKHRMGGDCLNTGCVPSKALIRTAKILAQARRAAEYGLKKIEVDFDFAAVMERVQRVIKEIEPHDSIERYTGLGVECVTGEAVIRDPWTVEVAGRKMTTRAIVVATGARPLVPKIEGLAGAPVRTSDNIWEIRELPRRLTVLGGGPIGCELAQAFARFGARVTLVEMAPRLLPREDVEVSDLIRGRFKAEGIEVLTGHAATRVLSSGEGHRLVCAEGAAAGGAREIGFDLLLLALGRTANVTGFGLEELGVRLTKRGTIEVDQRLRTSIPTIYACGDVAGPYQFTHAAAHQAWYASVNALFANGLWEGSSVDYRVMPWVTYVDPEVARVGLNELEAREKGVDYEVTTYGIDDLDRAIADGEAHGFVKVLTVPGKDRILGATVVGDHAGDYFIEFVAAMKHGFGLNKILGTIHPYPTLAEANKYAAGAWRRRQTSERTLGYLRRFQEWRRS